jgi:hypothetical protein
VLLLALLCGGNRGAWVMFLLLLVLLLLLPALLLPLHSIEHLCQKG